MKTQLQTIREGLERATRYTMLEPDAQAVQQALAALDQLEAMAGSQEPVAWMYRWKGRTTSEQVTRARWPESDLWIEVPLYEAAPVAQQPQADELSNFLRSEREGWDHRDPQPQAEAVPPGYVLVPVEPTEAMLNAADHAVDLDPHWIARAYRAMIAAAQGAKT